MRQTAVYDGASYQVSERPPWTPAQLVSLVAGLVLVVIGGVALARGGINFSAIPTTHSTVAGLHFTCLSALIQLIVGVILIGASAYGPAVKESMAVMGVLLLGFGLIVAIDPTAFYNDWGYTAANGVFYAIVGAILLLAAALSPVFFSSRRRATHSQMTGTGSETVAAAPAPPAGQPVVDRWGRPV